MPLSRRFDDALTYAAALHRDQIRKGSNVPYVSHLLTVCGTALEYGADEDEAIAALLHDAIEDQGGAGTREEIRRRFGDRVVEIVDGCSDSDTIPRPPWRERKEAYIAHLATAVRSVRFVSCIDKICNARTILKDYRLVGEELWGRFKGGREGTLWYYRAIVTALKAHGESPEVQELERVVSEFERLAAKVSLEKGSD